MKALSRKRKGGLAGAVSGQIYADLEREGLLGRDQINASEAGASERIWTLGEGFDDLKDAARTDGPKFSVYFVRMGTTEAVKVGMAVNLHRRLSGLQCGSPVKLHPIGYINLIDEKWMTVAERVAHHFAGEICSQKFLGEWFGLTDANIKSVAASIFDDMGWSVRGVALPGKMKLREEDISDERRNVWADNNKIQDERRFSPLRANGGICALDEYGEPNARARALGYIDNEGQMR